MASVYSCPNCDRRFKLNSEISTSLPSCPDCSFALVRSDPASRKDGVSSPPAQPAQHAKAAASSIGARPPLRVSGMGMLPWCITGFTFLMIVVVFLLYTNTRSQLAALRIDLIRAEGQIEEHERTATDQAHQHERQLAESHDQQSELNGEIDAIQERLLQVQSELLDSENRNSQLTRSERELREALDAKQDPSEGDIDSSRFGITSITAAGENVIVETSAPFPENLPLLTDNEDAEPTYLRLALLPHPHDETLEQAGAIGEFLRSSDDDSIIVAGTLAYATTPLAEGRDGFGFATTYIAISPLSKLSDVEFSVPLIGPDGVIDIDRLNTRGTLYAVLIQGRAANNNRLVSNVRYSRLR